MRASPWFLALLLAGCRPSATVENTMPVANLQSYRTVALNVRSTAFASQGYAISLERAVLQNLQQKCGFEQVGRATATRADVMVDLNITSTRRGSSGLLSNSSSATIDTLLVLSDGQNGDLLGTARITGKSGGVIVNNAAPETEAIDVVAKSVGDLLAKSGCSGPRIAKVEPPVDTPPPPGDGSGSGSAPPPPDETRRAEADALNEQGKVKLRSADVAGAIAAFQQANAMLPDARYEFNVCLAFEAAEQWDNAIAACRQARGMNPQPKLISKIDQRLEMLQQRK